MAGSDRPDNAVNTTRIVTTSVGITPTEPTLAFRQVTGGPEEVVHASSSGGVRH
jgi:hypothetical protein